MKKKLFCMIIMAILSAAMTACSLFSIKIDSSDKNKESNDSEIEGTVDVEQEPAGEKEEIQDTDNKQGSDDGDNLSDYTVVLDAGHGGGYSGAAYDGRIEKDITLKLALAARDYLTENYPTLNVYLTREEDSTLSGDVVEDLEMRAQFAKDKNAVILVSLHFNAVDAHDQNGCMAFISLTDEEVDSKGELFAENILSEIEKLGITNRGVKTRESNNLTDEDGNPLDYYAINRHCAARDIAGIIVEHCFIDNETDISFIDSDEDIEALAKADAEGIINALKNQ